MLDVAAFGAVGDGLTDDTAAIQRALTEAGPAAVTFEPRCYVINAPLRPASGAVLLGPGATLKGGGAKTGVLDTLGQHVSIPANVEGVVVDGFTFAEPVTACSLTGYERAVVHIRGARNTVRGCTFTADPTAPATQAVFVKGPAAVDNHILDNRLDGLGIQYAYAGASRTIVRGNVIENAVGNGISGTGNAAGTINANCQIVGNVIVNAGRMGIEEVDTTGICRGTLIQGNRIITPAHMGISAVGEGCQVVDNLIDAPGAYAGIETTAGGNVIGGNRIRFATPFAGIVVDTTPGNGLEGCVITGNIIDGPTRGISFVRTRGRAVVTGNIITGWTVAGIGPDDGNSIVGGNLISAA